MVEGIEEVLEWRDRAGRVGSVQLGPYPKPATNDGAGSGIERSEKGEDGKDVWCEPPARDVRAANKD